MDDYAALRDAMDPEEYQAALSLVRAGAVTFAGRRGERLAYTVGEKHGLRLVYLGTGERMTGSCSCRSSGICRHLGAAYMEASASNDLEVARRSLALRRGERLRKAVGLTLSGMEEPLLEITVVIASYGEARVSLRVGMERLYVVRSVAQFLSDIRGGEPIRFGKRFTYYPDRMRFSPQDEALLSLLSDVAQLHRAERTLAVSGPMAKELPVPAGAVPRLFALLTEHPFLFEADGRKRSLSGVIAGPVDLAFGVSLRGQEIEVRAEGPKTLRLLTQDAAYVYAAGEVVSPPEVQRAFLREMGSGSAFFCFPKQETAWAVSHLLPRLRLAGSVSLDSHLQSRLVTCLLRAVARLDRMGDAVTCSLRFVYGDIEIDPFRPEAEAGPGGDVFLARDAEGERRALSVLEEYGFRMEGGQVLLTGERRLFRFLTEGVPRLQEAAEVWLSEAFRSLSPRRARFSGRLSMRGSVVSLLLSMDGEPMEDSQGILEALRERRAWYRLPDGGFVDLSALSGWEEVADAALPAEGAPERGPAEIQAYRARYLMTLLEGLPVAASEEVSRRFSERGETEPCPEPLGSMLRPYQTRGFKWLQSLYRLGMGGVLADDMGLGKTVQIIALLLYALQREEERLPSIIVAPTSLVYNWQAEIARFAPSMRVLVAEGGQLAREQQLGRVARGEADVYLTSYPLLRRDIELARDIPFRFAVLDEAQYIKNATSVGAGAARQLQARARFALTGTPMENHPGELWSIVDFALPGYLGGFTRFMRRFGAGEESEVLRRRIRPFLLRRLKRDVLSELPEKQEETMIAEMTPEQRRVYMAALSRLRPEEIALSGGGRFRILAALTELRECCCHPALLLPDYPGMSGKLEMLMDLLPGALESGHRALIFSQFTRMLRIIERRLTASGIACFYLDGETPARERSELAERFNEGEREVFLISLKAGGAGLNLTGVDLVIHYDPWWNPAAEDQATDRAHRIGQTRGVTVLRLLTRGTIEEQVAKLGERKRALFERTVEAGETLPAQLTEEEIRSLFAP